jgi:hypothetical protein
VNEYRYSLVLFLMELYSKYLVLQVKKPQYTKVKPRFSVACKKLQYMGTFLGSKLKLQYEYH